MKSPIKKLTMFAVAMLLSFAAPVDGSQATAPKIVVQSTSFEFGDVYRGEIISHEFVIRNEGRADLVIKEFTAGCGCSVTEADRVIPPGKEGRAVLEVDTRSQAGAITKVATLRTNDPAQPALALSIVANVLTGPGGGPVEGVSLRPGKHIGPLFIGPQDRWIARVSPGQKASTVFEISVEKGPLKLLGVEGGSSKFVSRLETVKEGKLYRLVVEAAPEAGAGSHTDRLWVSTDSAALPSFRINLFVEIIASR
jgi:hypothetical protein